jgi:hypothetical protein
MVMCNVNAEFAPVLGEPILYSHCAVCGDPFTPMQAAYFGDNEDRLANETCEACWQWFRMEEFCLIVNNGHSWAGVLPGGAE